MMTDFSRAQKKANRTTVKHFFQNEQTDGLVNKR